MNSPARPSRQIPITLIVIAAFAAALGLWLGQRFLGSPDAPVMKNAVLYPTPRAVADFKLTQADGQPLTLASWRGHWNSVYFGYTSCPDVCPTTLAMFKQVWKDLGDARANVRFDFISVDPQRDTPDKLAKYVSFFNPDFIAATGTDEELNKLTRSLGLMYTRETDANGNIEVDHSGSVVIIDPDGKLRGIFRPPFAAADVTADLESLMRSAR
jgi:protein SCO1/2